MFAINTNFWCGQNTATGRCNVKCSNLIDDSIIDDLDCLQIIFDIHGFDKGWAQHTDNCKDHMRPDISYC